MTVVFTNWGEWNDTLAKMQAGLVVCPDCGEWVSSIYRIPDRLKRAHGYFDCLKVGNEYCCDYCMATRVMVRRQIVYYSSIATCSRCKGKFDKNTMHTVSTRTYCPDCYFAWENRKERMRVTTQNARTAKLGLPSDLTLVEWLAIIQKHNNKCAYCGDGWSDMEHVIPVSEGGGTTADNVVPSCRPCNLKKAHSNDFAVEFVAA